MSDAIILMAPTLLPPKVICIRPGTYFYLLGCQWPLRVTKRMNRFCLGSFSMGVYGRELLVSAQYKSVINTAAVTHTKSCIYTAVVQSVYIHCCRAFSMKWIHVFTLQSFLKTKTK